MNVEQPPRDVIAILIADSCDSARPINVFVYTEASYRDDFHGIRERTTEN